MKFSTLVLFLVGISAVIFGQPSRIVGQKILVRHVGDLIEDVTDRVHPTTAAIAILAAIDTLQRATILDPSSAVLIAKAGLASR